MTLRVSLPDVPAVSNPGLYELLQALRRQVVANTNAIVAAAEAIGVGGGDAVTSGRDPPSLVLDYGATNNTSVSSDAALAAYKADPNAKDVYLRGGEYSTAQLRSFFTKRHRGRGQFIGSNPTAYAAPANLGYLSVMPVLTVAQGEQYWFAGDQGFTDSEWKILGPNVRGSDPDARYFESPTIPHHGWWDAESGSSGIVGYATGGVAPGLTITLSTGTDPAWVGKKAYIKDRFGGAVISDTHAGTPADPHVPLTIASVAGNTVTFTAAHTANMAWNPAGLHAPCMTLSNRTWQGFKYLRVRTRAGGDSYGEIVRQIIEYIPKPWELGHVFNAGTGGQYGGSADFQVGTSGMMTTGWESQYNALGSIDVAVYAQVDSFVRGSDRADGGGRVWIGCTMQSSSRPCDAAYVLVGPWRRGLDTTGAFLNEGSYLTAVGSGASITVKWSAGARIGGLVNIEHPTTPYNGTITAVAGNVVSVTPGLPISYPVDSIVNFEKGGAAVIMAKGQGINWDGSQSLTGRGSDPLGVFGVAFGNQTGVVWTGANNDGSDYWQLDVGAGRFRMRGASANFNVPLQVGGTVGATQDLVTNGSQISGLYQGSLVFGSGLGERLVFNTSTNKFEFYINDAVVFSVP